MRDNLRILYGHLCVTQLDMGFMSYSNGVFIFNEELWREHCTKISNAGANSVRILPYGVWGPHPDGRKSQFCPWVLEDNVWDLSKFNDYYFPMMRKIIEIANAVNLEVWLPWFDSCQLQPGEWTAFTPWKHNIQGVNHFYDAWADIYTKKWVKRYYAEFKDMNVFWPWGNELDQLQFPEWAKRVLFPLIKELGIPFEKMTYGATMSEREYLGAGMFKDKPDTVQDIARKFFGEAFPPEKNKFLLMREVHKCGTTPLDAFCPFGHRPHQAAYWWGNKPVGDWVVSDDGVHECKNPIDGGRPNADRWYDMAKWAMQYRNLGGIEHLPEGGDLAYQVNVVEKGMAQAYRDKFGEWPYNHNRWPYVPPTPPDPPDPPIPPDPPEPPKPKFPWLWIILALLIIAGILILIL